MLQPCATCRREFNLELAYGQEATAHPNKSGYACPACWKKWENREYYRQLWTYGIVGLFILLVLALNQDTEFGWFCLNFCILFVFGLLSTIPHELGHALAGAFARIRIFEIGLGTGKIICDRRILGFRYRIGAIPFGGYVLGIPYEPEQYRFKMLFFVLAGPLANLLIAWKAYSYLPADAFGWVSDTRIWPVAGFIFVSNVWDFLYTIYPFSYTSTKGTARSDGLLVYDFLAKPLPDLRFQSLHFSIYSVDECLRRDDVSGAFAWVEKGLKEFPDDPYLMNCQATVLLEMERDDDARTIYHRLVQMPELALHLKYWVMANLAYTNIFLEEPGLLEEADTYSAEAFRNQPWEPTIEGIRAIVLNEMGRFDEGIPTLVRLLKDNHLKDEKSFYASFLALAKSRQGDRQAAQEYLQIARRFDPKNKLLKRVEVELADGQFKAGSQTPV